MNRVPAAKDVSLGAQIAGRITIEGIPAAA
jgi:hypothetical protein